MALHNHPIAAIGTPLELQFVPATVIPPDDVRALVALAEEADLTRAQELAGALSEVERLLAEKTVNDPLPA